MNMILKLEIALLIAAVVLVIAGMAQFLLAPTKRRTADRGLAMCTVGIIIFVSIVATELVIAFQ